MLTQARLKELFYYHPESGDFIRLVRTNKRKRVADEVGQQAGTLGPAYMQLGVDGALYPFHQLIWLYVYGVWPKEQVDHKNDNKLDNVLLNLREATHAQNKQNCAAPSTNTSGAKGVRWYERYSKFHVQIRANGVRYHIGYFEEFSVACEAWKEAAARLHGEFAHG